MSKRQKHSAFLKTLILHPDMVERGGFEDKITQAERDERCAWRAFWLMMVLAVFSVCGICYSAVFIPEFFQKPGILVVKIFCGLGLASLFCGVTFISFWLWCRGVLNRLHDECRRYIVTMLQPGGAHEMRRAFPAVKPGDASSAHQESPISNALATEMTDVPAHQTYAELFGLRGSH
jgi:hypothetical protein